MTNCKNSAIYFPEMIILQNIGGLWYKITKLMTRLILIKGDFYVTFDFGLIVWKNLSKYTPSLIKSLIIHSNSLY